LIMSFEPFLGLVRIFTGKLNRGHLCYLCKVSACQETDCRLRRTAKGMRRMLPSILVRRYHRLHTPRPRESVVAVSEDAFVLQARGLAVNRQWSLVPIGR